MVAATIPVLPVEKNISMGNIKNKFFFKKIFRKYFCNIYNPWPGFTFLYLGSQVAAFQANETVRELGN